MARAQFSAETSGGGAFVRQPNRFTGRVTADSTSPPGGGPGRAGPLAAGGRPVPADLVPRPARGRTGRGSCAACSGWTTRSRWAPSTRSATSGAGRSPSTRTASTRSSASSFLSEAYLATDPDYTGRVTVPALVDTLTGRVVTNDYPQLTLDLSTEWRSLHAPDAPDLYPVDAAPRDGRADGRDPHRRQQRRLPVRVRHLAGGVRRGVPGALRPAGRARPSGWPGSAT